jgi:geranylgeranyl diphosphate synthase, type I
MPTLPAAVTAHAAAVETALEEYLDEALPRLVGLHAALGPLADELRDFVSRGGKRLRPVLLRVGHELVGGHPDHVLGACVAIELLHTCALLHDDIIDGATTRRGHATSHVTFAEQHRIAGAAGSADHVGEAMAILLGDLAFVQADDALLRCDVTPDRLLAGLSTFVLLREEVMAGQALDVHVAARRSVDPELALRVATLKSGRYSVTRPLQLGAVLAGADDALLGVLETVGDPLGRAFQLRDDLLGVFGSEAATGKSATGDLAEGKRTLLIAEAWARLDEDGRARVADRLGAPDLTDEQADDLRRMIEDCGARAAVSQRITDEVTAARVGLAHLPAGRARDLLDELTGWFEDRQA